ncbi:hypothetical protein HYP93_gp03 [Stenotrophomonas phage Pokken]|uniref:Uncharacterized protein n=1 Tax=Stenotrophomonas phage Pokken TaxID=2596674 RepID=A0A5B9N9E0_9CAUD|nr:hypothetical protein HYP93_gp03 [Stenotrophomonas phage Pokken]QEG09226.1 hypothetical protein CPT_Pokken_003 [Stenotrophomonas phage Pokken]
MSREADCFEPARSYDIGTYLWSIGSQVASPEMDQIKEIIQFPVVTETAQFGFNQLNSSYEDYCKQSSFPAEDIDVCVFNHK